MSDAAKKLTDRYDREALAYRELWAPILRVAGLRLLAELSGSPAERIVDIGTGVGSLLPDLRAAFRDASIVGVDRSAGMLALGPPGFPRAVMDATRLAIASRSVDLTLHVFMLFHLESPLDGVRESARCLRPGGRLASVTWAGEQESPAIAIWAGCLDEFGAAPPDPAALARHDPVDTAGKMRSLLRAAGFSSIRAWEEDLVVPMESEHLLQLRTRMGSAKSRFDSLDAEARSACVAEARRRMGALQIDEFVSRARLVYAVAHL